MSAELSGQTVYIVEFHEEYADDEETEVRFIGVYSSLERAKQGCTDYSERNARDFPPTGEWTHDPADEQYRDYWECETDEGVYAISSAVINE